MLAYILSGSKTNILTVPPIGVHVHLLNDTHSGLVGKRKPITFWDILRHPPKNQTKIYIYIYTDLEFTSGMFSVHAHFGLLFRGRETRNTTLFLDVAWAALADQPEFLSKTIYIYV